MHIVTESAFLGGYSRRGMYCIESTVFIFCSFGTNNVVHFCFDSRMSGIWFAQNRRNCISCEVFRYNQNRRNCVLLGTDSVC